MEVEVAQEVAAPGTGPDDWIEIGRLVRAHGLRGCAVVQLHAEEPTNLGRAERVRLSGAAGVRELSLRRLEPAGTLRDGRARVRVWLEGLDDRSAVERWRDAAVLIPEAILEPLPEGEYYWRDLIGVSCQTRDGRALGVIDEILPTGSNDVLVVRDGPNTHLIPTLRHVLVRLDREAGVLWIDPPPGLLEDGS